MKGMILAAGIGSRLRPITNTMPKALVKVGEYTMLEYSIAFLKKFGIEDIIINVHHFADQIIDFIRINHSFGISISISEEREELLDTGGGMMNAADFLRGSNPFVLINSDLLTNLDLRSMIDHHLSQNNLVTMAVKDRETSRSLLFDNDQKLCGWRDNTTGEIKMVSDKREFFSAYGFSCIHVIDPIIFDMIKENGAFSIIDLYLRLAVHEQIGAFVHNEDHWLEFGRLGSIEKLKNKAIFNQLVSFLFD